MSQTGHLREPLHFLILAVAPNATSATTIAYSIRSPPTTPSSSVSFSTESEGVAGTRMSHPSRTSIPCSWSTTAGVSICRCFRLLSAWTRPPVATTSCRFLVDLPIEVALPLVSSVQLGRFPCCLLRFLGREQLPSLAHRTLFDYAGHLARHPRWFHIEQAQFFITERLQRAKDRVCVQHAARELHVLRWTANQRVS